MSKGSRCGHRVMALTLVIILMLQLPTLEVKAYSMTDIRVGLQSLYTAQEKITVSTVRIALGYCINNSYVGEYVMKSDNGFVFSAAKGYYYILNETFKDYASAKAVAESLSLYGVNAFPAVLYRNTWTVYVGGDTNKTAMQNIFKNIRDKDGYTYQPLSEDNGHRILVSGSDIYFIIDGSSYGAYPQFTSLVTDKAGNTVIDLGSRQYRGRIEIGRYGKATLSAVNVINIEAYLYGVIPSEMVSTWPEEALKAQAVCARSYALCKTGYSADSNITTGYVLDDTVSSQVYKGYAAECTSTTSAVKKTQGETVCYNGETIMAFFFSTSGGMTENCANVWGIAKPYYEEVTDIYETSPERSPWIVKLTAKQIAVLLTKRGLQIDSVEAVIPQIVTSSGRVYSMLIQGAANSVVLQTGSIRDVLELDSTRFKVIEFGDIPDSVIIATKNGTQSKRISDSYVLDSSGVISQMNQETEQYIVRSADNLMNFPRTAPVSEGTFYFAGMGYGHGVGMSQSGAYGMAEAGFSYVEIIEYYFKGTTVEKLK